MRHIAAGIYRRREMLAPNSPGKAQAFATPPTLETLILSGERVRKQMVRGIIAKEI
jgi:hypothetical protein